MNPTEDIKKNVLERIRNGTIAMHSRAYFALRVALSLGAALLALMLATLVISFSVWGARESGELLLLGFGSRGFAAFFGLFPWNTLVIVIASVVIAWLLIRRFRFGYRTPLSLALLVIFGASVLFGFAVAFSPLHPFLQDRADSGELPFFGEAYESLHASHPERGFLRGVVTGIKGGELTMTSGDADGGNAGTYTVVPPSGFDLGTVSVGERLYVAGAITNGVVDAYGIRTSPFQN